MLNHKNTRKQGDHGMGDAIAYYTSLGWGVSIPLTDSQKYDLIVDDGAQLLRVQVKTTRRKRRYYEVTLQTSGGNKSRNSKKKLDRSAIDIVYVLAENNRRYAIPVNDLGGVGSIALSPGYDKFCVGVASGEASAL